jgi:hypothetical protein
MFGIMGLGNCSSAAKARAYGAQATLRHTLFDLAKLNICEVAIVGLVLRQQLEREVMQRAMDYLVLIYA